MIIKSKMRRNCGLLSWLLTCLTIVFIVLNTRSSMEFKSTSIVEKQEEYPAADQWITRSHQMHRYVTPSLAELRLHGHLPSMYKHVLMLTRIPGTGAELMSLILQRLQEYNAFKHIRLPSGDHGSLSTLQQELLIEEITNIIKQEAIPLSFDRDVRFLDFSEFGRQGPTFISVVRNPLDSRIWQRFRKAEEMLYRGAITYFCGQNPRCMERDNTWALERAKTNVIRWYPVVGVLEHIEESLQAFEAEFPYFFKNAVHIYEQFRAKEKKYLPTSLIALKLRLKDVFLRNILIQEIEFYEWLKYRLFNRTSDNS